MREIKFRAWDLENKRMFEVDGLSFRNRYITDEAGQNTFKFNQCILMQFTGLHDKNGKEIYEGDIVKEIVEKNIYTIIWAKDWAQFVAEKVKNVNLTMDLIYSDRFEVIGNIYENPELLKEEIGENN